MALYFASFGTGPFCAALDRIRNEAQSMQVFEDIFCMTENDFEATWYEQHKTFIESNARGFGYYIWKAQVVHQVLQRIPEGGVLLYADCGCTLNPEGIGRLREYMDLVQAHQSGILCFALDAHHTEARWTKMDVLKAFGFTSDEQLASPQLVGGIFMMVNNAKNRHFVDVWKTVMETNYHFINDRPSKEPNHSTFTEHRHDQSVWSIIRKVSGCLVLPDETWWAPNWDDHKHFPIHAKRLRC